MGPQTRPVQTCAASHRIGPYTKCTGRVTYSRAARGRPRRGRLPAALRDALRDEARRLSALHDPMSIMKATAETLAGLEREAEHIAAVRLRAVKQLRRDGWSYDDMARASGMSKSRIQQLVGQAELL